MMCRIASSEEIAFVRWTYKKHVYVYPFPFQIFEPEWNYVEGTAKREYKFVGASDGGLFVFWDEFFKQAVTARMQDEAFIAWMEVYEWHRMER